MNRIDDARVGEVLAEAEEWLTTAESGATRDLVASLVAEVERAIRIERAWTERRAG